jgi:hypothetical protein
MELMPNIDLNHPGQSAQTTASKPGHTALTLDEVHNLALSRIYSPRPVC